MRAVVLSLSLLARLHIFAANHTNEYVYVCVTFTYKPEQVQCSIFQEHLLSHRSNIHFSFKYICLVLIHILRSNTHFSCIWDMNQNTHLSSHTHFSRIREMNQNTHSPSSTYFSFIREIKQNTHCPSHTHFSAHTHFSRIREMNQNTHFSSNTYFFFIREMNQNTRYYHSNTDFSFKYAFLLTYTFLPHTRNESKHAVPPLKYGFHLQIRISPQICASPSFFFIRQIHISPWYEKWTTVRICPHVRISPQIRTSLLRSTQYAFLLKYALLFYEVRSTHFFFIRQMHISPW